MTPLQRTILFGTPALDLRTVPNLAAWYDLSDPLSYTLGTGVKLLADKSGNSAVNVLALNGSVANYASVPNSGPLDSFTALELVALVEAPNWNTPTAEQGIMGKDDGTGNKRSFRFFLQTNGYFYLALSTNGTVLTTVSPTTGIGKTAYAPYWLKVTWDGSTGNVNYYQAAYQPTEPVSWTQAGTTVSSGITGTLYAGSPIQVGSESIGYGAWNGNVYRAIIRRAIGGASVLDADFTKAAKLAASFVCDTGQTVTINTSGDLGASICGARDLSEMTASRQPTLSGGGLLFDGANYAMGTPPFLLVQPITAYLVGRQITWGGGGTFFNLSAANLLMLAQTTATPTLKTYGGSAYSNGNSDLALGVDGVITSVLNGASSTIGINRKTRTTGSIGTSASDGGFILGARTTAGNFINALVYEIAIFSSALPPQDAQIVSQLIRKWKIKA
jgi:hypothetical protein